MAVTTPVRLREGTIFLNSSDCVIFYVVQSLGAGQPVRRPCGPMDKASVYGTGDCRFESYQGHFNFDSKCEVSSSDVCLSRRDPM